MSEWISVEDRLPDEDQWVIIPNYEKQHDFEPSTTMAQYRNCFHGGCCGIQFYCVEASGCMPFITHHEVMHWMPLPEPPIK